MTARARQKREQIGDDEMTITVGHNRGRYYHLLMSVHWYNAFQGVCGTFLGVSSLKYSIWGIYSNGEAADPELGAAQCGNGREAARRAQDV